MKKILIASAGGAPSEGVINSLLKSDKKESIIGMGSVPTDLVLSNAAERYYIPYADASDYRESLLTILKTVKPDLVHFQHDLEIYHASMLRDEIHALGVKTYMPDHDVIDTCVHKYKTYLKCKDAGIKVPVNMVIDNEEDLRKAFADLGDANGKIWLRASSIGGGGKGALPTNDFVFAKGWIERYNGWGDFVAAEMLTPDTVTWLSIWHEGELVVAQTRIRKGWTHGNRSVSGVTGVTKVGQTYSNPEVDRISIETVKAVSAKPHGIFGVDMTYDKNGVPNPTEINISRFFTTVLFFTEAGLNMPEMFKDIALYNEFPSLKKKINPLEDGLMWLRGMDTRPLLLRQGDIEKSINNL
jgi:carbamoyl-phosphate synthase large subunit